MIGLRPVLIAALFAATLGCGHRSAAKPGARVCSQPPYYDPREVRIPIRTAADVVGSYGIVCADGTTRDDVRIEAGRDGLRYHRHGKSYRAWIDEHGRLRIADPSFMGGALIRRGDRTLLYLDWVYQIAVLDRLPSHK